MGSGIKPSAIPGADLDPDAVLAAANALGSGGGAVRDAGADVVSKWRGLGAHYEAPEAGQLFTVMDPVETNARTFGDAVEQVASVLTAYAEQIRPIKASLAAVTRDAYAFRSTIASNAEWEYDQDLVDENTALVNRVNSAQIQLWEAERTCANGIRALCCAAPWHAASSENDPLGYGVSQIPADAPMAWGSSVERKDHCPKSAAVGVKRFVWDGVVVDGLWGTVVGLGALVGVQDWSSSWDTMKTTWTAMGGLIGYGDGQWSWGNAGDAWLGMGKGLISYDAFAEGDAARGAGGAVFNIGTFLIPVAGQAAGVVKGGALAAKSGRTASWLAKGAKIVDYTDPLALALKGGTLALPKMDDLLAGMRGATAGLGDALRVPDVPTNLDLPPSTLDDLADGLPPVRDPDGEIPTVHEPVEVHVPANQLVGPDGTPVHDGGTNNTGGGIDGPAGEAGSTGGESGATPGGGTSPPGTTLLDKAAQQWPTHTLLELDSGARGTWTTELHTPAPDSVYVVDGDKIYVTDHAGRVEHVEGQWQPTSKADADLRRNEYQQGVAGRGDRLPTDVGGHWIAASGGGPGEGINLTAMDRVINGSGGAYGRMEAQVRAIVEANPSTRVDLRIDIEYPLGSGRPDFVSVDVYVDGVKTSTVEFDQ